MVTMSQVAEIAPARQFRRGDRVGNGAACSTTSGGKLVRQMVLADDDLDIHAEIVRPAQNLDDAAHRARPSPDIPASRR